MIKKLLNYLFRIKPPKDFWRNEFKQMSDDNRITNTTKSVEDKRDYVYVGELGYEQPSAYTIPTLPPVRHQGSIGSCASHAAIGCYEIQLSAHRFIEGSELFHYYNARKFVNNTFPGLGGMTIRDCCKTLKNYGFAFEQLWKYNVSKVNVQPANLAYVFSKLYKIKSYERLYSTVAIKASLLQNIPVMCGILCNNSFYGLYKDNYLYNPKTRTGGGHAVIIVGYDDTKGVFIIRNSWGKNWGNKGYFEMSYESFVKTSFDWFRVMK